MNSHPASLGGAGESAAADRGVENVEAKILALEAQRCRLLGAGELAALAALLDDDYVHVHGNGRVTDKAGTLERLGSQARATGRGSLTVRSWGDAALVVGEQINRTTGPDGLEHTTRGMVTQTLRRRDGCWRFASLQFTALPGG